MVLPDYSAGHLEHPSARHQFYPTNLIPLLQVPRFHTLGAPGSKAPAFAQRFVRAEEAALGVSFNAQSQAPDIPGISSRVVFSCYTASLQTQSKDPDIQLLSL